MLLLSLTLRLIRVGLLLLLLWLVLMPLLRALLATVLLRSSVIVVAPDDAYAAIAIAERRSTDVAHNMEN